jgi:hypothetical protein
MKRLDDLEKEFHDIVVDKITHRNFSIKDKTVNKNTVFLLDVDNVLLKAKIKDDDLKIYYKNSLIVDIIGSESKPIINLIIDSDRKVVRYRTVYFSQIVGKPWLEKNKFNLL